MTEPKRARTAKKRSKPLSTPPESPEELAAARQRARERAGEDGLPSKAGRGKGDGAR